MAFMIHYFLLSHIGKCRSVQQDNYVCCGHFLKDSAGGGFSSRSGRISCRSAPLFGVFDGMGGEELGEVASALAAREAASLRIGKDAVADMARFYESANRLICSYAQEHGIGSMGTTAALLCFDPRAVTVSNLGDSKVFRFSDGRLQQISRDHLGPAPFGAKAPLSQNLGIPPEELVLEPYYSRGPVRAGDLFLLCSDGLTDMVSPGEIQRILAGEPLDRAAAVLLDTALAQGGRDNVTILLCRVERAWSAMLGRLFRREDDGKGDDHNDG